MRQRMCRWKTNETRENKGTTAAGQARLAGLCLLAPGRVVAPRQETQTQTQTET